MSINSIIFAAGLTMANLANSGFGSPPSPMEQTLQAPSTLGQISSTLGDLEKSIPLSSMDEAFFRSSFTKLSSIQNELQRLKIGANHTALFAEPFIKETEERIITLFGNIHSLHMDYEVVQIKKDAGLLAKELTSSSSEQIAMRVDALRERIFAFLQEYAPGAKNLGVLHQVQKFLNATERSLQKGTLASSIKRLSKLAEMLFEDDYLPVNSGNGDDENLVSEYLKLQELLQFKKNKEAKAFVASMDPSVQKALRQKLQQYELDLDHKMALPVVEEVFYDLFICTSVDTPLLFDIKNYQNQAI